MTKLNCLIASLAGLLLCATGCCTSSRKVAANTPASARVAFENDKVRVIEYHTGSEKDACGFGEHTHPAHLAILLTDSKFRVVGPDGKESIEPARAGDIEWYGPEQHVCENIMGNDTHLYVIEIKDKDWKPSTGLIRR